MIIVTFCWLSVIHLFRLSFHRERILLSISAGHLNISKTLTNQSNQNNFDSFHNNSILNNDPTINHLSKLSSSNISTNTSPINSTKSNRIFDDDPVFRNKWSNFSLEMLPTPMSFVGKPSKYRNRLQSSQSSSSSSSSSILNNEYPRSKFDAPYMMTWYCTIWNVFYLPVYLMIHMLILNRKNRNKQREQQQDSTGSSGISTNPFGSNFSNKNGSHDGTISSSDSLDRMSMKKVLVESIQGLVDRGFTMVQFFWRCTFFSLLCLLSNYMLIFSLRILDATIVMALVSTSVSVVYLLSWVVLHQQFVGIRIVGIIIVDTGVALLVYMDGIQHQTLAAVMMAFGSAIIYAVYRVFMRRMIGFTTFGQMALFHSLIGLMNIFFAWPLILILYATGVEIIQWGEIPWLLMTGASVCSIIAQLIASFGVICTYEFFLALGIFFAVPASAVIDLYLNSVIFKDMKLSGVLLICFGFLVVLLPENWNGYLTDAFRNRLKKWKNREENKKNGRIQDTTTGHLSRLRTSSGRVK
ncbi:Putative thiamine transporter SLC35F3 [Sarcoptes scabiei]|uniref:Putative thiamine transporter SLC35F3 n=1 Tax=Sarcoptes scabiei TaxID=52283 RepID=A0A834RF07_SARSC|nr:Putative thiamine transporter SLC35F3 [Sarcoptes scabiei]